MATFYLPSSGSYSTSNSYIVYRIEVAEGTFDSSSRTRPVTVSVKFWRTNNYTTTRSGTCYCTINGTTYSQAFSNANISLNSYTELFNQTITAYYDTAGNCTLSLYAYWQTASGATGSSYTSDSQGGTITLTSVGSANHTVSYNANGGAGAPAAQTKVYGSVLTLSSTVPTRSYYNFVNWNTAANGGGNSYSPGGQYREETDCTLYAQWSPYTCTIAYDANGGTGAPPSQTKTYGISLYLSTTIPTRDGYRFNGWNTAANGSGTSYSAGQQYLPNHNGGTITLYAQWTETYTITYNANGGMDAPSSQTEVFGTSITIPYTIPTKENYSFLGWSLYSTATSPSYYPGGTFDIYVTTTLYAIWAEQTFQDIYIYSDMTMYAKEFIEDNSMYIDKYGRLYAGEFIEGSAYIDSGGAIAMNEFIEGSLNTLVDENNNILTDEDGNQLVGLN